MASLQSFFDFGFRMVFPGAFEASDAESPETAGYTGRRPLEEWRYPAGRKEPGYSASASGFADGSGFAAIPPGNRW